MQTKLRAKELALEGAIVVFLAVALLGIAAGAEHYVAVVRALVAGVAVAFVGRLPARVLVAALEAPERDAGEEAASAEPAAETRARGRRA